ncbi:MAG: CBS domain-containing protein [Saprospiraceae bacterium]
MSDIDKRKAFIKSLLQDIEAFDMMVQKGLFENDIKRIGAEQELVIVDKKTLKARPIAPDIISNKGDRDWLVPELSTYNLEINLPPYELQAKCFSQMEELLRKQLHDVDGLLAKYGASSILTGILPTMQKHDLNNEHISPYERYHMLMKSLTEERKGVDFELRMSGIDELLVSHDSALLEACNTSFQVHLQVMPDDFRRYYNNSLALTAPVIALSSNSPLVFGKRLWHESRIALFQQAIDTRLSAHHMRERSPRVILGTDFLHGSIVDIYKEDLSRFKVLFYDAPAENALEVLAQNGIPKLKALAFHNSTVYRWNRACFGISDTGKPHMRIENRVIPSGPSVVDEIANAAFWIGCMEGFALQVDDVREKMSFEDVRDNFSKSARMGIDSKFTWFKDKKITAKDLILKELIPMAREGLKNNNVATADIDKYMGIIEERTTAHMTGARWMLRGYTNLLTKTSSRDEALSVLTSSILKNQEISNNPVHKWNMPKLDDLDYLPLHLNVVEVMDTTLFTVHKDDPIELVAELMDYNRIRYTLVEDKDGSLIGLLSAKLLLKQFAKNAIKGYVEMTSVATIMVENPISISPKTTLLEAIEIMSNQEIGCLPVLDQGKLVGVITEKVFVEITSRLLSSRGT